MKATINTLYDILIQAGIKQLQISSQIAMEFSFKNITYWVQLDVDGTLTYGPIEFANSAVTSEFLRDSFQEFGSTVDFEDFVYGVVGDNLYGELYRITEKLLKIEDETNTLPISVDFEKLVNDMFNYGNC